MYWGDIFAVLSPDAGGEAIASALGKRRESDGLSIYYRKEGDYLRSVLLPTDYPKGILRTAEAATLAGSVVLRLRGSPDWTEGELALLADASGAAALLASELEERYFNRIFGELPSLRAAGRLNPMALRASGMRDEGLTYVDRVFQVKGVGVVATGFSLSRSSVHQELVALPSGARVEVRSIQVLDEDQKEVGPGVRVGYALRDAQERQLEGTYMLLAEGVEASNELEGTFVGYRWSEPSGQLHAVCRGASIPAELAGGDRATLRLSKPAPLGLRCVIVAANARRGRPRVVGYFEAEG